MSAMSIQEQYRIMRANTRLADLKALPRLSIFVSTLAGYAASFALVVVIDVVFGEALEYTRIATQSGLVGVFISVSMIARSWRPVMLHRLEEEIKNKKS
jgi:hypothetical protein